MITLRALPAVLVLAGPASAAEAPGLRLRAFSVLENARASGLEVPELDDFPEPATPFSIQAAPPAAETRLFREGLWSSLPAPHPEVLRWLVARSPGLNPSMVREIDEATAFAVFDRAVAESLTPMDLFTDPGLRGPEVFYFPKDLIEKLFASYEIRVITLASGVATDGQPYAMQAMLAGARRTEPLYERSFTAENPYFPEYTYNVEARVVQTINAPGDVGFMGLSANAALRATIRRMVKTGPREVRIETNWGSRSKPMRPLRRR